MQEQLDWVRAALQTKEGELADLSEVARQQQEAITALEE